VFKDIKTRKKPFVILQFFLVICGLILGGVGAYLDSPNHLGWMLWLFAAAFLLRGIEGYLCEKKRYTGYLLMAIFYLAFSFFVYPIW
jgi:hypothetical protein